jgi:hypothetical protein
LLTDPENGIPVQLRGENRSPFDVNALEGQFCEVSITHDADLAQAIAMVPKVFWSHDSLQPDNWKNAEDYDGWAMDLKLSASVRRPLRAKDIAHKDE